MKGDPKPCSRACSPILKEAHADLEELLHRLQDTPSGQMVRCSKARAMFAMRACRKSIMIGTPLSRRQMTSVHTTRSEEIPSLCADSVAPAIARLCSTWVRWTNRGTAPTEDLPCAISPTSVGWDGTAAKGAQGTLIGPPFAASSRRQRTDFCDVAWRALGISFAHMYCSILVQGVKHPRLSAVVLLRVASDSVRNRYRHLPTRSLGAGMCAPNGANSAGSTTQSIRPRSR